MAHLTPSGNLQRSSEVLREAIIHVLELYDIHYSIEREYWGVRKPSN